MFAERLKAEPLPGLRGETTYVAGSVVPVEVTCKDRKYCTAQLENPPPPPKTKAKENSFRPYWLKSYTKCAMRNSLDQLETAVKALSLIEIDMNRGQLIQFNFNYQAYQAGHSTATVV